VIDNRRREKRRVDPITIGYGLAFLLYVASLFLPACYDAERGEPMTGLACVLFFPVNLFFPECWANVTLLFSQLLLVEPKAPETSANSLPWNERLKVSVFFSMASIALASVFFIRYELPIGPAATSVPIEIGSGYFVWLGSMITIFVSQVWALKIGPGAPSPTDQGEVLEL
jgi:hypothetical protein